MKKLFYLIITFLMISCQKELESPTFSLLPADPLSTTTYDIYSAALDGYTQQPQLIVLQNTTPIVKPESYFEEEFKLSAYDALDQALYGAFLEANEMPVHLDELITPPSTEVIVFPETQKDYFFIENEENAGWNLFAETFPNSNMTYLQVNKASSNQNETQAFVGGIQVWAESIDQQNVTKKYGWLTYLNKVDGKWEKIKTVTFPVD